MEIPLAAPKGLHQVVDRAGRDALQASYILSTSARLTAFREIPV